MKIVNSLHELTTKNVNTAPAILTIGNFDGLHLGHQALLKRLCSKAALTHGQSYVLTFENHPSKVLSPALQVLNLTTPEHKIKLLKEQHIDNLILLPFTLEFSQQTAEQFLRTFYALKPFTELLLGHDAVIGKARHGNRSIVENLAKLLHFEVEYLVPTQINGIPVSSSQIRQHLKNGNLPLVQELLGRPYSIYSKVIEGKSQGRKIGFPTANIIVEELCLPPLGVYAVDVIYERHKEPGIANLGIAPTVRDDTSPLLEVHLLNGNTDLYGKYIEVIFKRFIRSEKKFDNLEDLKSQIAKDVALAKT